MTAEYKVFLDSNILVYAHDLSDFRKQKIAQDLISECAQHKRIVISTQVLNEFVSVCMRKLGLAEPEILLLFDEYAKLDIVQVAPAHIREAIDFHFTTGYSFYDSLIIASAVAANCQKLYTEDMADGQQLGFIQMINPF